ncbi:S-layer homology domain-containing protein [Salsuginibacillus kocurii]|uniref:S-layer homology domain-containing protein n=1 Tax=Salsuginibacillus kocurii TaxID=427078 RepID=UPI0023E4440A|nr:S-layer homology domain-containing protein [Salsuginibacillus kocurii]
MTVSFADVNESTPHYEEIIAAAEAGIFSGSTTNYFHGERELRREEAAAIFVRSFDFTGGTLSSSFTDIEGRPFAEEIMALCEAGIIEGVNEAEFAPEQTVTRREFALMLSRALEAAH